jgi:hypothetical protein
VNAVWAWVRADLRARWRSWLVLGLLAGATVGLAAAAVAGARRTAEALPNFVVAAGRVDAAVLPNDPSFDGPTRRRVAELPEVQVVYPFVVSFFFNALDIDVESGLLPRSRATTRWLAGVVIEGRLPRPNDPGEVVIDENMRRDFGLEIGSRIRVGQTAPEGGELFGFAFPPEAEFRTRLRVVGITHSHSEERNWTPSSAFYRKYRDQLLGPTNMFVRLEGREAQFDRFRRHVQEITGRPTNVERASEFLGVRKSLSVTAMERDGLLLFAFATLLGGGVLVGQALMRAVNAGAADLPVWRALGADRRVALGGLALPATITALTGAITTVGVAIALSARFPIATARRFDVDVGTHADWPVLGLAALGLVGAVAVTTLATAAWRLARRDRAEATPSSPWASRIALPPAMMVGTRLAFDPGRGRRSVPVRSALVGAAAGVLGVTACLTFRAGIADTVTEPGRSGIVWDFSLVSPGGRIDPGDLASVVDDRDVAAATEVVWARAVSIDGTAIPTFGTMPVKGDIRFVVLDGHAPRRADELALAPVSMRELDVSVGDEMQLGPPPGRTVRVVGEVLLPPTSHTDYDVGAWVLSPTLDRALPPPEELAPEDIMGGVLVQWAPGVDVGAAQARLGALGEGSYFPEPAALPSVVQELGRLRRLPLALAVFFALLAVATVAHALVTTVRRRTHELAVMRSLGLTRRQSRLAIGWQSTLFAIAGIVIGIPSGISAGRTTWRWLADDFSVLYVAPLTMAVALLIVPFALAVANALAIGPAFAAVRTRPAEALRTE